MKTYSEIANSVAEKVNSVGTNVSIEVVDSISEIEVDVTIKSDQVQEFEKLYEDTFNDVLDWMCCELGVDKNLFLFDYGDYAMCFCNAWGDTTVFTTGCYYEESADELNYGITSLACTILPSIRVSDEIFGDDDYDTIKTTFQTIVNELRNEQEITN